MGARFNRLELLLLLVNERSCFHVYRSHAGNALIKNFYDRIALSRMLTSLLSNNNAGQQNQSDYWEAENILHVPRSFFD